MASTVTPDSGKPYRGHVFGTLNLGTYATGGVAVTPQQFGFNATLEHLDVAQSAGTVFEWVASSNKVKAFQNAAGAGPLAEVANATNLGSITPRFLAIGY